MGTNVPQQIQGAAEQRNADSSTSNDRRETERINTQTIEPSKRRLLTKPKAMAAKRKTEPKATEEVDHAAAIAAQRAALHLPIIVGEREGEPNYKKPNERPASPREPQQPSADPEDDGRERRVPLAPRAVPDVDEGPSDGNPPPAPLPEGAFRPCVGRLQETLFALDDICMRDGRIRVQVEEIGRLLAVIRRKESEVVQKVRDVQRTRVAVENLFTSRVKVDPSLLGQGQKDPQSADSEDGARTEPAPRRKRRAEESDAGRAPEEAQRASPKRVVIVGAGCFGLSTGYHLLKRGYKNVTILDRSPILPAPDAASTDIIVRSSYGDIFYTRLARDAIAEWRNKQEWDDTYHESGVYCAMDSGASYIDQAYENDKAVGAAVRALSWWYTW
ncbi:hypothetical protein V8D89_003321 [Ganoderma adspersum]